MDAMREMERNQFDLAIVDPPYGIREDGAKNHSRDHRGIPATKYTPKLWDKSVPPQEYFDELMRVSKNQLIFGANYMIDKIKKPSMGWVFWDKQMTGDFSDGELVFTSFNRALRKFTFTWNGMLQGNMKNKERRIHPTQKPVALYKWLLNNYAKEGDNILDTHLGSGSIAIACWDLRFDLTAYELDEEYYRAAVERFERHTAQLQLF